MTLEQACKKLIIKEPFWGIFLLGLNKSYSDKVPTLGVRRLNIGVELIVNKTFWDSLKDESQLAVLLHELHHISLNHLIINKDFENHKRFNIAADAEVNCYISNLPEGTIYAKNLGFEDRMGAKWYYEHLNARSSSNNSNQNGDGNNGSTSLENLDSFDDHSHWKEFDNLTETEKTLIQNEIDYKLKNAAEETFKQRGTIPGCLKEIIEELFKKNPPIYNWKSHFRRILSTEIDTQFKKTYKRLSKRFPNSPGIKLKRKISILIAVDTSGSVSKEELAEFFTEINHIHQTGAKVTVLECDTIIQKKWEFKGIQDIKISGRGGTDFEPAIEYYKTHKSEYSLFVFFTDGYAPIDNLKAPHDMFWVITSNGNVQNYPGKVIYIPMK